MTSEPLDYSRARWPIRADLTSAHQRAWQRLGAPGTWLTGQQRVAVAAEVRAAPACARCHRLAAALSPFSEPDGKHIVVTSLPDTWIDVIHRVRNDAARLTDAWYKRVIADGLRPQEYVEIVGVLATVVAVDSFCDALSIDRHALPEPIPGEPPRVFPANARAGLARVPTLAPEDVTDAEADLYKGLSGANIHRALSLVPAEVLGFFDIDSVMYLPDRQLRDFAHEPRAISHAQIEFVAARVSALNNCFY